MMGVASFVAVSRIELTKSFCIRGPGNSTEESWLVWALGLSLFSICWRSSDSESVFWVIFLAN